jgi:hypothetical protein
MKQEGGSMLEVKQHVKWMMKQGDKIKDETYSETFIKTCKRRNEKHPNPTCYIHGRLRIVARVIKHMPNMCLLHGKHIFASHLPHV